MHVFAVVGGIGAGKSTVCEILGRTHGAVIIDADRLGHQVLESASVRRQLIERFGGDIVGKEGRIDRRRLGNYAFSNLQHRQWLDALVHPVIGRRIRRRLRYRREAGIRTVLLDAALYFEAQLAVQVDAVLAVTAPRSVRRKRLAERDDLTAAQIEARLDSQPGVASWSRRADVVINTNGSRRNLPARVEQAWRTLQQVARHRQ